MEELIMALVMMLANGFEEIEALGTLDLLRRAGVEVTTCTLNTTPLTLGAHGIAVEAELCLTELDSTRFDGVILPGGLGGSQALAATQGVLELIKEYDAAGKLVCAICAAPALVLTAAGILPGRPATCYPAPDFTAALGAEYRREKAVVSGNLITAEGPGRFKDFARAIIVKVKGEEAARQTFADALLED